MALFHRRGPDVGAGYDPAVEQPAVRRSICTGEMTVGFVNRRTGRFRDVMKADSPRELEAFCRAVGVEEKELRTIY